MHRVSSPYYGVCVKIFMPRFRPFGTQHYSWSLEKGFFSNVRLSHFSNIFCGKVNVIVCYMGTFFQAFVLKFCPGYLVHITEYVWKFFAISSIRAQIMGKKGFFQMWDLLIFSPPNFSLEWAIAVVMRRRRRRRREILEKALLVMLGFWNFAQTF